MVGDPSAPLLGLLTVLAACGVLLAAPRDDPDPGAVGAMTGVPVVTIALAGSVVAAAEAASAFGVSRAHGLAVPLGVAAAGVLLRRAPAAPAAALFVGSFAVAALVALIAIHAGAPPWVAWARLASEPVLVFPPAATWVTEGRAVPRPTTVTFAESHRLTAVTPGVFRVAEPGPEGTGVREWRLTAGDSLTLRAGDRLTLNPGTRVRFEAGKRIPGAAESGVAWAEPRTSGLGALAGALGLAVTLGGGAVALVGSASGSSRLGALAGATALVVLVAGAASWGVYGAWLTPDLALGGSPLISLVAAPLAVAPPALSPAMIALLALIAGAALFGTAASLALRADDLVAPCARSLTSSDRRILRVAGRGVSALMGGAVLAGAGALAWYASSPETALRAALGLGASGVAARLIGSGRGVAVGTAAGACLFAALWGATALGLRIAPAIDVYPALVAAPLAAAVAALVGRRAPRAAAVRRSRAAHRGCPEEGTLPQ